MRSRRGLALSGPAIAAAAAGLFLSGAIDPAAAADKTQAKVQCHGVNACKGQSECGTARSSCHGQNACKGQGWVTLSEKECAAQGGTAKKG
jgi:hypothetical protein